MRKKCVPIIDPNKKQKSCQIFNKNVTIEDFDQLTTHQYSHNSLLSMMNDWNHLVAFCQRKKVQPLPASTTAVRLFLEQQMQTRKYATIKRMTITIGLVHRFHQFSDPCNHKSIKMIMAQIRLDKKGDANQANAFEASHLKELQQQLTSESSLKQLRDVALLSVMFECALKRSELKALTFEQLNYQSKESIYHIQFNHKTYQLSCASSDTLRSWVLMVSEQTGPLFRRIDRHGNIGELALDASSIYRVFRAVEQQLNVNTQFTGQSARVGAAKELAKQGYHLDITEFGRWVSSAMPAQYLGKQVLADQERFKFKVIKSWDQITSTRDNLNQPAA